MKLRKKTGIMMAATAAVAVVGVAAVSFAAWTGAGRSFTTAEASLGDVNFLGFTGDTSNFTLDPLVPWDQNTDYIKSGSRIVSKELPAYDAYGTYTVTVESTTGLGIYVFVGAQKGEADISDPTAENSAWKSVQSGAVFTFTPETDGAQSNYISVMLDSDTYTEHTQKYTLTITLAEVVLPNA